MTRFAALMTAVLLALSVTGCGADTDEPISTDSTASVAGPSAPALETPDPTGAVELVVSWAQAIADGDGPEACGYQTREFTRTMIRETVNKGFAAAGSSCNDVVTSMSAILKSFGATGKPTVRLLSANAHRATVTIGLATGKPNDAYSVAYKNGEWVLAADVTAKVLKK